MSTTDHAALMDGVYRHQRHIYDLTRKYYLFGRDRLIAEMKARPGERIVEVGCGTARNLIRMARLYPETELFGLDASSAMLETAQSRINRAGFSHRIRLVQGYAECLSPAMFGGGRPFDHVVFSYALSMIPDWKQALETAGRALEPGGRLHLVDFADLSAWPPPLRAALRYWLSLFHVAPRLELLAALAAASDKCEQYQLLGGHYAVLCRGAPETLLPSVVSVAPRSQPPSKSPLKAPPGP